MFALILTVAVFLFWTLLGRALLALFCRSLGVLRPWLIAPGVGFAFLAILMTLFNQAGLAIKSFAWPLSLTLLGLAIVVLRVAKLHVPFKALFPFVGAIIFSLIWSSWPMLHFGFNWLSYVNDDFTNYCLSAEKFKDFGFYRLPQKEELLGTDYSQYYWFMHAIQLMRFGSEHAIAWLSSLTHKASIEIFMPVIMAFAMAQNFAVAGLVLAKGRYRRHALWTSIMLSFSPMFLFGSLYQLIAQVSGVCLLLCLIALFTAPLRTRKRSKILIHAVVTSIVAAALCIFYPEVTPFAALTIGLYMGVKWLKTRVLPGLEIVLLQYTILGAILILRYNAISYLYTLANQFVGGTRRVDLSLSLFPFFLIPSGLPSIFGLQAMNQDVANPWGSIIIFLGLVLLILCFFYAFKETYKCSALGCLLLVDFGVALMLYLSGNDFGLYKVVMFMQPLLMAALAGSCLSFKRRSLVLVFSLCMFLLSASTALVYTRGSIGAGGGMTGEVSLASQLIAQRPLAPHDGSHWESDIDNVSAAKLVGGFYRGTDISFICRDYFYPVFLPRSDWPYVKYYPNWAQFDQAVDMMTERTKTAFVVKPLFGTTFTEVIKKSAPDAYLSQVSELSLFNKIDQSSVPSKSLITLVRPKDVHNRLAFIHSEKGNQYYLGDRRRISYFQQEDDFFGNNTYFNGIGQFMLLRVQNSSPSIYLRISATKTLMGGGHTEWSPQAAIIGQEKVYLGKIGSGAMNLIVGPIKPVWLDGQAYIAIDFNQTAIPLPTKRTWLKALYNSNINLDYRRLVGFGRDISALSEDDLKGIDRPRGLGSFPSDIVNAKGLEYSGIYEDGWISPYSHFVLSAPRPKDLVRIKGFIPDLPGLSKNQELTVSINKLFQYKVTVTAGLFDWAVPVPEKTSVTQIDIESSATALLPAPDSRPVIAKLSYIGLESKENYSFDYSVYDNAKPISDHIALDGWAGVNSTISIPVIPPTDSILLNIEYPGWSGVADHSNLRVYEDDNSFHDYILNQGNNKVLVSCKKGKHELKLRFESSQTFVLPSPDLRRCAFRLVSIMPNNK